MSLKRLISRLRRSTSGVAFIEFAYGLPAVMGLSMYGIEIGNY